MYSRYRYFVYFLAALVLGSILLSWLSGSIRVPSPQRVEENAVLPPPQAPTAVTPAGGPPPPEPYAPSYEHDSYSEKESSKAVEPEPPELGTPPGIANSSDLPPPAPAPTVSPEEEQPAPDRGQITTSPKSSNAALREQLKKSKGR